MKKVLLLSSILALGAVASYADVAAPATCVSGTAFVSGVAQTCEIGDKLFTNLTVTGTGGSFNFTNSANQYGLDFNPTSFVTSAFSISYTVSVDTTKCASCVITQIVSQFATSNTQSIFGIPNTSSALVTFSTGGTKTLLGDSAPDESASMNFVTTSEGVTFQYTPGSNGELNSAGFTISQASVPEPMTFSLMGAGLLGLGLLRKRISRS